MFAAVLGVEPGGREPGPKLRKIVPGNRNVIDLVAHVNSQTVNGHIMGSRIVATSTDHKEPPNWVTDRKRRLSNDFDARSLKTSRTTGARNEPDIPLVVPHDFCHNIQPYPVVPRPG